MATFQFFPGHDRDAAVAFYDENDWVLVQDTATSVTWQSAHYRLVLTGTGFSTAEPYAGTVTGAAFYKVDAGVPTLLWSNSGALSTPFSDVMDHVASSDGLLAQEVLFGADDRLIGTSGDDVLFGYAGADILEGGGGNDWLDGFQGWNGAVDAGADSLFGGAGNDTLRGDYGDLLTGGSGDDLYLTMKVGDGNPQTDFPSGATVFESAGQGHDTVRYSTNDNNGYFYLPADVEQLDVEFQSGAVAYQQFFGRGNGLGNLMQVSQGPDGHEASVFLLGNAGNDTLIGGNGHDYLFGGSGADSLVGGKGSDHYGVDRVGDVVVEATRGYLGGIDWVESSISYRLGANLENLQLQTSDAVNGYGNTLDNLIVAGDGDNRLVGSAGVDTVSYQWSSSGVRVSLAVSSTQNTRGSGLDRLSTFENLTGSGYRDVLAGTSGDNILDGNLGSDRMTGYGGNDTYVVDDARDLVIEATHGGTDRVISYVKYILPAAVENLTLDGSANISGTGNWRDNVIVGNDSYSDPFQFQSGENVLWGMGGNDTLEGGTGNDVLVGGTGADVFRFSSALVNNEVDRIADFVAGTDHIALDRTVFAGIGAAGPLNAAAFRIGTSAADASDRVIYDPSSGLLYYDVDGSGATGQIVFGRLTASPSITAADFVLT